jgi:hypothetical protein
MSLQQLLFIPLKARLRRLVVLGSIVVASPCLVAQEPPGALSLPIVLGGTGCHLRPHSFQIDGRMISVWQDSGEIVARSGTRIDNLETQQTLVESGIYSGGTLSAAADPRGGLIVAWTAYPGRIFSFSRFGADLQADGVPVEVGRAYGYYNSPTAIAADPNGALTVAWLDSDANLRVQRFAANNSPLTPAILVQAVHAHWGAWVVNGPTGFLIAWSESEWNHPVFSARLRARAYNFDGTPRGAATDLLLAHVFGSDLSIAVRADGSYLVALADYDGISLVPLDDNGVPKGLPTPLGLSGYKVDLAIAADQGWLAFGGVYRHELAALDPTTLTVGPVVTVKTPEPGRFVADSSLAVAQQGVLVSWQIGRVTVITPEYCFDGLYAEAQHFGPIRGVVDVPALSDLGRFVLVLALGVAGLLGIRVRGA